MQTRGTAMGANVAPTYANIFVAHLEETHVYGSHHFSQVLGWWRFIDDVFLIWKGTVDELKCFHEYLNTIDEEVGFTLLWSKEELQFLDTKVMLTNGALTTTLYKKETDRNTLLRYDSCHP